RALPLIGYREGRLTASGEDRGRDFGHVAGNHPSLSVGDQIQTGPWTLAALLYGRGHERQTTAPPLFGEAAQFRVDRIAQLLRQDLAGALRDVENKRDGKDGENGDIDRRKPEGRRIDEPGASFPEFPPHRGSLLHE